MKRATALAFAVLIAAVWVTVARSGVSAAPPAASSEQPFQVELSSTVPPGTCLGTLEFPVPAGKTFTLEHFSSRHDNSVLAYLIQTTVNGVTATHSVVGGTWGGTSGFAGESMRLYASGGTTVRVTTIWGLCGSGTNNFTTTLSGTLK